MRSSHHVTARSEARTTGATDPSSFVSALFSTLFAITLAALLAGCSGEPEPELEPDGAIGPSVTATAASDTGEAVLTTAEFVEVLARLREAERSLGEEADSIAAERFQARKQRILAEHGVTEEELMAFVEREGREMAALQALWDSLNQRLKHVPGEASEADAGMGRTLR